MIKLLAFTGLLISVAPAAAQTQPQTAPATRASKDSPDRMICRTEEQIGSRLASKRVCMTATQWKDREQQVRSQLDQEHIGVQSTPGPG